MADFGIISCGAYVPRLRIARSAIAAAHSWMAPALMAEAKGCRAFPSWDEDAVTMAVEAARDCLIGIDRDALTALTIASTTFPYADLQHSALVADSLGLPATIRSLDIGHSQRAGTSGLLQALKANERSLVIASDAPKAKAGSRNELGFGAGAAAFALGQGEVIARLIASASLTDNFVDHFRASGEDSDYVWEERWIRDEGYLKLVPGAIGSALDQAGFSIENIDTLVMPSRVRGIAPAIAKAISFRGTLASGLEDGCGYAGTAHALLMLAHSLESAIPGQKLLLIGFGQGVDVLVLEAGAGAGRGDPGRGVSEALANALPTDSYLRMLSFYGGIELDWGMRSERINKTALTEQYRSRGQISGFVAGCCGACGTVQFPQLEYCVNPECQASASGFTPMPLTNEPALLLTHTADWLSYYPAPPLHVGFVQFANGARLLMEVVDVGPEGIEPGAPLKMVMRIKERDEARGYNRYFWKATPNSLGREK